MVIGLSLQAKIVGTIKIPMENHGSRIGQISSTKAAADGSVTKSTILLVKI
jgi:hypothetical protein